MSADRPAFRQVAELLRERIAGGWYPEVLPTESALAAELGIDRYLLRLALGALSGEGLIEYRPGMRAARVPTPTLAGLVSVCPGQLVLIRMPTYPERLRHNLREGVPILLTNGRIYRADQFAIIGDIHGDPSRPRAS